MANILLIDDDASVRRALSRMLLEDQHEVREASDGHIAVKLMRERPADIVISDVYMPEMDGIELLIRMHGEFPATRVVMMTGGGNLPTPELLAMGKTLGARAALAKPFTPQELRDAISACDAPSPPPK